MENDKRQTRPADSSAWMETLKHEARAELILFHGIRRPTDHQIYMFMLYGERAFPRKNQK